MFFFSFVLLQVKDEKVYDEVTEAEFAKIEGKQDITDFIVDGIQSSAHLQSFCLHLFAQKKRSTAPSLLVSTLVFSPLLFFATCVHLLHIRSSSARRKFAKHSTVPEPGMQTITAALQKAKAKQSQASSKVPCVTEESVPFDWT